MKNKVRSTLLKSGLIKSGDKILVGLSGGADSVCLTHALWSVKEEVGIEIMTAHVNHMIRGARAAHDALFASEFSRSLGLKCVTAEINIPKIAKVNALSEETAGREERYKFFAQTLERYGFNKIATAHNLNDSAETITMNFMRGGALSGLSGIPAKRGDIIRPLLGISRAEIEDYCRENSLNYVTDATNADDKYTRNRIRNTLIPFIERDFNPDFINGVTRNAEIIRAEDEYMSDTAKEEYRRIVKNHTVEISELLSCHTAVARRIVRLMISSRGDAAQADFVLKTLELAEKNKSGSYINLPGGKTARVEYGRLIIGDSDKPRPFEYRLPIGADVSVPEAGIYVRADIAANRRDDGAQYFSGVDENDLIIRSRRNGDYFYPAGMSGRKKLKDYFIDEKIPRSERDKTPIITSGADIVCIVGYRRDRRFAFNGGGIRVMFWR